MTLHCIYSGSVLSQPGFLEQLGEDDALLLLGSAVYLAAHDKVGPKAFPVALALYALDEDLQAYGITSLSNGVTPIDYDGWVQLSTTHSAQQVWAD